MMNISRIGSIKMARYDNDITEIDQKMQFTQGRQLLRESYTIFRPPKGPVPFEPRLSRVAYEHWAPGFHIRRVFDRRCFWAFIESGQAECLENGARYAVLAQQMLILRPGAPVEVLCTGAEPLKLHILVFDMEKSEDLPGWMLAGQPVRSPAIPAIVRQGFNLILDVVRSYRQELMRLHDILDLYLAFLLKLAAEIPDAAQTATAAETRIKRCCQILEDEQMKPPSIADVARRLGVSAPHLSREFHRIRGVSPRRFLQNLRMQTLFDQLIESDRTLDDLAEEFGFACGFSLSRAFKRHFGIAPAQLRRQHHLRGG
ncbi:MAG: AraC family transcriptional regulator [Lentisphaerae bacterium]|nr:MAG: AraC family transcriptional regulator [Lentisphaerota bacterium]